MRVVRGRRYPRCPEFPVTDRRQALEAWRQRGLFEPPGAYAPAAPSPCWC